MWCLLFFIQIFKRGLYLFTRAHILSLMFSGTPCMIQLLVFLNRNSGEFYLDIKINKNMELVTQKLSFSSVLVTQGRIQLFEKGGGTIFGKRVSSERTCERGGGCRKFWRISFKNDRFKVFKFQKCKYYMVLYSINCFQIKSRFKNTFSGNQYKAEWFSSSS